MVVVPDTVALRPPPHLVPAQIWRGRDNGALASGYEAEGCWWIRWPGVGTFLLDPGCPTTQLAPEPGVQADVCADAFRRGVVPLALLQRDHEVLHASAVWSGRGVVAFCATSRTGKSTLAASLRGVGYEHWADDFLALRMDDRGIWCPWFPSRQRLEADAAEAIARTCRHEAPPVPTPQQAPLTGLAILERDESLAPGEIDIARIPAGRAFTKVLSHAHECQIGGARRVKRSLERHLELCARVPVYRVAFKPDLRRLRQLARGVASWMSTLPTPTR